MSNGKGSKLRKEDSKKVRDNWGQVSGLNRFIPDWLKCPKCGSKHIDVNYIDFEGNKETIYQCSECDECFEL